MVVVELSFELDRGRRSMKGLWRVMATKRRATDKVRRMGKNKNAGKKAFCCLVTGFTSSTLIFVFPLGRV